MFKKQNISIYPSSIDELEIIIKEGGFLCPFVITGKKSFESSGAEKNLQWLFSENKSIHFNDFEVNPKSEDVDKAIKLFQQSNCDVIISIGGGSVIDMAKLINYYHSKADSQPISGDSLVNYNPDFIPHITIPTTAGSGSESTHFAVMYINNNKYSIAHDNLLPDYVIIDPTLLKSQTGYQIAVSGIDALAQSMESLWNVHATALSVLFAEKALKLIYTFLPDAVLHKNDKALLNVAIGANLAGRAINITKTTAPHALSYGFTKLAGLPHGHAVALSLPFFFDLHQKVTDENCNAPKGKQFVLDAMDRINSIIDSRNNSNLLQRYFNNLGIETNAFKLGISNDICKKVIEDVNLERLANNPVKYVPQCLLNYYTRA